MDGQRLRFGLDPKTHPKNTVTILEFPKRIFHESFKIGCKKQDWDVIYTISNFLKDGIFEYKDSIIWNLVENIGCVEKDQSTLIRIMKELRLHFISKKEDIENHIEKDNVIYVQNVMICRVFER